MNRTLALCLVPTSASSLLAQNIGSTGPLPGYTVQSSQAELGWEHRFRAIPEAARAPDNMRFLAAHQHKVGSESQRQNAEWILALYKEWGCDAHIEQFDVLYGAKTIPGVREALEDGRYPEAAEQFIVLSECIEYEPAYIASIASQMSSTFVTSAGSTRSPGAVPRTDGGQ